MAKITKTFQYGKHEVTLETGEIARQAGGAVIVKCDGTVLLVTAVATKTRARRARTSSRSPSTTRRSSTPAAASRVASSSAKAARPRRKR